MKALFTIVFLFLSFLNHLNAQFADPVLLHNYGGYDAENSSVIEVKDLDQDGYEDIICGSTGYLGKISVFYGNSLNSFDDRIDVMFNANVLDLEAADINNDGLDDIVVSLQNGERQSWLQNLGNRSFSTETTILEEFAIVHSFAVVDFDKDGNLDVVSTSLTENLVFWCKGLGNGLFDSPSILLENIQGLNATRIRDLDDDGDFDILPLSYTLPDFGWYKNNGSTLEWILIDTALVDARSSAIGDIDSDLDDDIIIYSQKYFQYRIYTNEGNGSFVLAETIVDSDRATFIKIKDINQDNRNDILSVSNSRIEIIEHNGGLNFAPQITLSFAPAGVYSFEFINVNDDGVDDLVVRTGAAYLYWFDGVDLGDGNPTVIYNSIKSSTFSGSLAKDLIVSPNQNGFSDIMCVAFPEDESSYVFQELKNNETGSYYSPTDFYTEDTMKIDDLIFSADLNNDSKKDILYGKTNTALAWIEKNNNGEFLQENVVILDQSLINRIAIKDIGDIDNDGDIDVLCRTRAISNGQYYLIALVNDGAGGFDEFTTIQIAENTIGDAKFGDFDDDGDLDVIVANGNSMRMFINDGIGNYPTNKNVSVPYRESTAPSSISLQVADLDGDGDAEVFGNFNIVVENWCPITHCSDTYYYIHVIYDHNGNNLVMNTVYNSWFHPSSFPFFTLYKDYNDDGNIDMLTAVDNNTLVWLLGDGTGQFPNSIVVSDEVVYGGYSRNVYPNLKAIDVDLDGDLDVISLIANQTSSRIEMFENLEINIIDNDNDGFLSDEDCDDNDSTILNLLDAPSIQNIITICERESIDIPIENVNAGLNYIWDGPNNYSSDATNLQLNEVSLNQAGTYYVASYINECVSPIVDLEVIVNHNENASITFDNNILSAEPINQMNYQWLLNGDTIVGATSSIYQPTESGNYSVITTNSDGCEATSNEIQVTISGLNNNIQTTGISIYPNPISLNGLLNIELNATSYETIYFELFNSNGSLIQKGSFNGNSTHIETSNLVSGLHILKLNSSKTTWVKRFVVY